jgi:hypothetical protein
VTTGPEGLRPWVQWHHEGLPRAELHPPLQEEGPGREEAHRGEKAEALTPELKRSNRELSRARAVVEHTISRVKKFDIFGQEFRNRLRHCDLMTDMVPGLVNLRIMGAAA